MAKITSTVSTSSLINALASQYEQLPKKVTKALIADFLSAIESEIAENNSKVRLDRVGIIQVKDRAARMGRNPQTGEEIKIPASKKIAFRAAKSLKEAVGTVGRAKKVVTKK